MPAGTPRQAQRRCSGSPCLWAAVRTTCADADTRPAHAHDALRLAWRAGTCQPACGGLGELALCAGAAPCRMKSAMPGRSRDVRRCSHFCGRRVSVACAAARRARAQRPAESTYRLLSRLAQPKPPERGQEALVPLRSRAWRSAPRAGLACPRLRRGVPHPPRPPRRAVGTPSAGWPLRPKGCGRQAQTAPCPGLQPLRFRLVLQQRFPGSLAAWAGRRVFPEPGSCALQGLLCSRRRCPSGAVWRTCSCVRLEPGRWPAQAAPALFLISR